MQVKLKYNDIKWSIPFLINNFSIYKALNNFLDFFMIDKNFFNSVYGNVDLPVVSTDYLLDMSLNRQNVNHFFCPAQIVLGDAKFDKNYFNQNWFNHFLEYVEKNSISLVISDNYLFDYIKEKFSDITLVSSENKFSNEIENGKEVEFIKNLLSCYDRVILHPVYVKGKFKVDYTSFDDVSKFEIYPNYSYKNEDNENFLNKINSSLILDKKDMDFLVNEAKIKNFRLFGAYENVGFCLNSLFEYVFESESYTNYVLTEYIDQEIFPKYKKKEGIDV